MPRCSWLLLLCPTSCSGPICCVQLDASSITNGRRTKPDHAGNVSGVADTASSRRNVTEFDNTVFAIFTVAVQTVNSDRNLKGNYELWSCSKQTAARMK